MHGSKGLSAKTVFIPGLEQSILPGARRTPYPGLVREAARMLYVSITRARVACYVSYARQRVVNGESTHASASVFATQLGAPFVQHDACGLSEQAAADVVSAASNMAP